MRSIRKTTHGDKMELITEFKWRYNIEHVVIPSLKENIEGIMCNFLFCPIETREREWTLLETAHG